MVKALSALPIPRPSTVHSGAKLPTLHIPTAGVWSLPEEGKEPQSSEPQPAEAGVRQERGPQTVDNPEPLVSLQGKNNLFPTSPFDLLPERTQAAGAVSSCQGFWRRISSDPWLLSTIQGVEIPFVERPRQSREPAQYRSAKEERVFVDQE